MQAGRCFWAGGPTWTPPPRWPVLTRSFTPSAQLPREAQGLDRAYLIWQITVSAPGLGLAGWWNGPGCFHVWEAEELLGPNQQSGCAPRPLPRFEVRLPFSELQTRFFRLCVEP